MKALCALSGLTYRIELFPASLSARETYHPVFDIRPDNLFENISDNYPDNYTPQEIYLAFLALLHSTRRIEFRVPVKPTIAAFAIANSLIERTLQIVQVLEGMKSYADFTAPSFVIIPDNSELQNVSHIIDAWAAAYKEYREGHKRQILHDAIATREQALERLIRDPSKSPKSYSNQIAKWANISGAFPTGLIPVNGKQIPLNEYWMTLIRQCASGENLLSINDTDLHELVEHCENEIPHGSIYATTLMRVLRDARDRKISYLDLGDFDITASTYRILGKNETALDGNVKAMIDSAPEFAPKRGDYPSQLAYIRAQFKYEASLKYGTESGESK